MDSTAKSSPHDPKPPPAKITYAPPLVWYRTRRFQRAILLISIAILLIYAVQFAPTVMRRAQLLYLQRQCLSDSLSLEEKSQAWDELAEIVYLRNDLTGNTAFIGSMQDQAGNTRLVIIDGRTISTKNEGGVVWNVVQPATFSQNPRIVTANLWVGKDFMDQFFVAHRDPDDASHLILKAKYTSTILDVWLRGDMLIVEPREPALSASATTQPSP